MLVVYFILARIIFCLYLRFISLKDACRSKALATNLSFQPSSLLLPPCYVVKAHATVLYVR